MTVRDVYEATLVEINKEDAQSFTTEEFNYVLNKAILAFVNEKYNFYAANQQISDDLRVLIKNQTFSMTDTVDVDPGTDATVATLNETTSYALTNPTTTTVTVNTARDLAVGDSIAFGDVVTLHPITDINDTTNTVTFTTVAAAIPRGAAIKVQSALITVPTNDITTERTVNINFDASDYLHLISCRVLWKTKRPAQDLYTHLIFPAKRLTYDMLNAIQNNTYLRPAPNRPYYQIFDNIQNSGVVGYLAADYTASQNKPKVKLHIGTANTFMELRSVEFDYIKLPETVTIYDTDIFSVTADASQVLELPDYLLNEVVRRCTIYLLEKSGDPRIQTQPAFNQEIPAVPMNMQTAGQAPRPKTEQAQTQQQ